MMSRQDFSKIQPYNDSQVKEAIDRLLNHKTFVKFITDFFQTKNTKKYLRLFRKVNTIDDFQRLISVSFVKKLLERTSDGLTIRNIRVLDKQSNYLFITNHRDIVLDSSLLNYALVKNGFETTQIAIGSNLLIKPWIVDLVKLNKSFIVERGAKIKQSLTAAKRLSCYIRHTLVEVGSSVWIAQREGRTKNGNDQTQPSLLKMLNISGGTKDLISNFSELNIVPVSISYENEPCDAYKVNEIFLKQSMNGYVKTSEDDLKSMLTGLITDKGRINLHFGEPLNTQLPHLQAIKNNRDILVKIVEILDYQIQKNYFLYPNNFISYDLLKNEEHFLLQGKYTTKQKKRFWDFISGKIDISKNRQAMQHLFLTIYAHPVINKLCLKEPTLTTQEK